MPFAIDSLLAEHDECRRYLESAVRSLANERTARGRKIRELLDYLDHGLETHIAKEEQVLFPRLKSALPRDDRLIDEMIAEHDLIRIKRGELAQAIEGLLQGHEDVRQIRENLRADLNESSTRLFRPDLRQAVAAVAEKLRIHFENEEELVFPLVPRLLSPEELEATDEEIARMTSEGETTGATIMEQREPDYVRRHGPLETPLRVVRLEDEIKALKAEPAWLKGDRTAKTLVKEGGISAVLMAMKSGTRLHAHRAEGALTIQCLNGRIVFSALERRIDLGPGEIAALDSGIEHSVEAVQEAAFLLTISSHTSS
jgi:hemerythrin-like domain-containing protein/quercetin dioxygenase-like cupin family protein